MIRDISDCRAGVLILTNTRSEKISSRLPSFLRGQPQGGQMMVSCPLRGWSGPQENEDSYDASFFISLVHFHHLGDIAVNHLNHLPSGTDPRAFFFPVDEGRAAAGWVPDTSLDWFSRAEIL